MVTLQPIYHDSVLQVTPRCSATCLASEIGIKGSSKECHCRTKPAAKMITCDRIDMYPMLGKSSRLQLHMSCTCRIRASKKKSRQSKQLSFKFTAANFLKRVGLRTKTANKPIRIQFINLQLTYIIGNRWTVPWIAGPRPAFSDIVDHSWENNIYLKPFNMLFM